MKHRRLTIWSGLLLVFNILVIVLLALGFLAAYIPPDKYWVVSFAGLAFPYAVIANLFFVFIWMFLWRKLFLISLIALLICWSRLTNYLQFDNNSTTIQDTTLSVNVISYNVQIFDFYNWGKRMMSQKGWNTLMILQENKPDLICLQEYHQKLTSLIRLRSLLV
jgi:hypothetical protein